MAEYSGAATLGRSEIRRRVLNVVSAAHGEDLHLREIARRAGTSAGTASRELRRLEEMGLIVRRPQGSQVCFVAVGDAEPYPLPRAAGHAAAREAAAPLEASPLPDPVSVMVARRLRRALQPVFGERLVDVYLFGSRARGDHEPDSDIDVLIVLADIPSYADDLRASGEAAARLSLEAGVSISRLLATEQSWLAGDRPILRTVAAEGIRA
jgi:uncharacterized protein